MANTSHRKSTNRAFDCIYSADSSTTDEKSDMKSLKNAKNKSTTVKLYPRHEIMFSKEPGLEHYAFRKELTPIDADRNSLTSGSTDSLNHSYNRISARLRGGANNPAERRVTGIVTAPSECKTKALGLDHFIPDTKVNVVEMKLNLSAEAENSPAQKYAYCKYFPEIKEKRVKTRGTQSIYRESSAQTLPYLPEVSNTETELEQIELFKLPTILPGDGPPGLYEVEVLERARKRWAFARALKENMRRQIEEVKEQARLSENRTVLQAFEWEHWIEREEYIQECQMLRLEILIGMFNKREEKMHATSKARIERSYEEILARRDASLHKNQVEYERGIRQLEIKRRRVPKCWRKENIVSQLGSPSSEFYGPQLRYGVNPARRHFVGGQKEFDARMDDLEKRAVKFTKLVCPFAKLKEWATPKQRLLEIEQNFCSDENLQKIYDTLTSLRKQAVKQKVMPKCLILKKKQPQIKQIISRSDYNMETKIEENVQVQELPEIKASEGELKRIEDRKFRQSIEDKKQRAQYLLQELYNEEVEGMVQEYEGSTIGWIMRFLSEEMGRLQEQRLLHYITMLAQKERWRREAAEAGLRQKENNMRQIYEQVYKETMEVCLVGRKYLSMILDKDIPNIAHHIAEDEVLDMARVIDKDIQRWLDSLYEIQNPLNYNSLRYKLKKIIFPDLDEILKQLDIKQMLHEIIEELLFETVFTALEPYDICTTLVNELIDRLIDLDLYYFTSEETSNCSCIACECAENDREIRAIIRKLIRSAVPGRRWKTPLERTVKELLIDLIKDVVDVTNTRGSIFESDSLTRFCKLQLSPSHMDLRHPSIQGPKITSSETSSSSIDLIDQILTGVYAEHEGVRAETEMSTSPQRREDTSSDREFMPESFYYDPSEFVESEPDTLSPKALNQIYKELLHFLGTEDDNEDMEQSEDRQSTSRSSQSPKSSDVGLRSLMDEVFRKISILENESGDIGAAVRATSSAASIRAQIKTDEDEVAEIYKKSQPLELISEQSSEQLSIQSSMKDIKEPIMQEQVLTASTALKDTHSPEPPVVEEMQEIVEQPELEIQLGEDAHSEKHSALEKRASDISKKSSLRNQYESAYVTSHVRISEKSDVAEFKKSTSQISVEKPAETRESAPHVHISQEVEQENEQQENAAE
ncbi:cilia- and flagella-associated protein 91-like [Zeugodacus cucurbitae]|uniref:cilia- and flagella-associated protein 91-like n=1 Tax=Zeugodacus cucurbitae TaxID=28588 RepID=UPI0010A74D4C|nr:cilia- and flagella-associated protein 91-like [Zeugodacus cucurbitae]